MNQADIDDDPPPVISCARYSMGKLAVRCPSPDGRKVRVARLADHLKARWSGREGAYIMSPGKVLKLMTLCNQGRDASCIAGELLDGQDLPELGGTIAHMPKMERAEGATMTLAQRQAKFRQEKRDAGLKEIRNLWVHPEDEPALRAFADMLAEARAKKWPRRPK